MYHSGMLTRAGSCCLLYSEGTHAHCRTEVLSCLTVHVIIPLTTVHDKSINEKNTQSADYSQITKVYTSVGVVYGSEA